MEPRTPHSRSMVVVGHLLFLLLLCPNAPSSCHGFSFLKTTIRTGGGWWTSSSLINNNNNNNNNNKNNGRSLDSCTLSTTQTKGTTTTTSLGVGGSSNIWLVSNEDENDNNDGDDDDETDQDEEDEIVDPYTKAAGSEFDEGGSENNNNSRESTALLAMDQSQMDWGGALGILRKRVEDVQSGKSQDPSNALFRLMTAKTPNELIAKFVSSAEPQVVTAMSQAVTSLLGGLSNPVMGMETIVKTTGDKIGNLCLQLQMTGYMFRNAEYVVALKKLMDLSGGATLQDYRDAFARLDTDGSGYIESSEVKNLLDTVYDGKTPAFEIESFIQFFDRNNDGRISWQEFELGLGNAMAQNEGSSSSRTNSNNNKSPETTSKSQRFLSAGDGMSSSPPPQENTLVVKDDNDDDDDDDVMEMEPEVMGEIEIEMDDGAVVKVEAREYIQNLKREAKALQEALLRETGGGGGEGGPNDIPGLAGDNQDEYGGIVGYIASRQGDLKGLTQGIQPEIMETMKKLVDYVLESGKDRSPPGAAAAANDANKSVRKEEMEVELRGSALQQLALWQLVLGYRLREAEAKGEYLKLLEE